MICSTGLGNAIRIFKLAVLPIQLYCHKLFKHLSRNYYVGLFSAAKFHGASHQQVQRDYVITEQPKLNDISKNTLDIRFFTTRNLPDKNIQLKKVKEFSALRVDSLCKFIYYNHASI